jgi:hypothetical protein
MNKTRFAVTGCLVPFCDLFQDVSRVLKTLFPVNAVGGIYYFLTLRSFSSDAGSIYWMTN